MRARPPLAPLAVLAAALLLAGPARAQDVAAEPAVPLADSYQLTNADGDRVCPLVLTSRPHARKGAPAGQFDITLDRAACGGAILFSVDIASWAPGPGESIWLQGPDGRLVAEFTEGVGGTWEALREGDGVYFLVNPRLADPALRAADLVGGWDVAQTAGRPLCRIELTDTPAGGDVFRASLAPGCAAAIVALAPDRWRLDGSDLVLLTAQGEGFRLARQEDGSWEKVPPGEGTPLLLSRP
ncbi:protease inhibitor Inh/omp19 family protein [Ancylobacter sp. TS-1]|uniref:protease inhibitor Inh/omp19 family protein n=1 Tax=Ancylobacter sp. TS-1 TaxID=1850374 RepID=UPI001265C4C9|nr:protease inhibitor Inh/omp19 family protein [Ancylobacter sp. TS-1]QFR33218.1 hypothetical protein GBB76_08775 [Ancylobacter sp. TS-1]